MAFDGGEITSDAGLVLLREFDERVGVTAALPTLIADPRDTRFTEHELLTLLRQRLYQIAAGYEDANDATALRRDPTLCTVAARGLTALASQPTLSRLENGVAWESIRLLETQGTEWLCRYEPRGPRDEIILDVDSTEDPTHGQQPFTFFNQHYGGYMYHPVLIFDGRSGLLLGSRLRPGNAMGSRQVIPLLRPLLARLRGHFGPAQPLALRADGEFAKPDLLAYAERHGLRYAIGFARNSRLQTLVQPLCEKAEALWERRGARVRLYASFSYQAHSWHRPRRVVAKIERTAEGRNLRFVVTNRRGRAQQIFHWYEQRGQAENYIKELKNDLAADRLSCAAYRANAFRLQLHAYAYNLAVLFRRRVLVGTELARSTMATLRGRLFKVGARVHRSVRRVWFHLASGWPGQALFERVLTHMAPLGAPG
ncbi:IS1380 family transposase [bacterium]|nr:IS1380 family transposase [bacterium]MBX3026495.1 IS1380 family transposase [bacterium]MBX3027838.1 IS1380 family transposase [bacterium]